MRIETRYNIYDYVLIKPLNDWAGRIIGITVRSNNEITYEVEYFADMHKHSHYFLEDEIVQRKCA